MSNHCLGCPRHHGFTILELLTVLALLGAGLAVSLPAARGQRDRTAVLGAREDVASLIQRARAEAIARGGATVRLTADPPVAELMSEEEVLARSVLGLEYGADLVMELSRDRAEAELTFDALGIGRISSQTIQFRRGHAEAALVVSSFGRVVRR